MVRNIEAIKNRYMQDDLRTRLGGIAANLARIASCSHDVDDSDAVFSMLEESEFFIEWTAPEAPLDVQIPLVQLQIELALWRFRWAQACSQSAERERLGRFARTWSSNVLSLRE